MASEVVKYAPKAVIQELNENFFNERTPLGLFRAIEKMHSFTQTREWMMSENALWKQLAIIDHVFKGVKLLEEKRYIRYYVQNAEHGNTYIEMNGDAPAEWDFNAHGNPKWQNGMTKEQADGYAALFGGEPKEIK